MKYIVNKIALSILSACLLFSACEKDTTPPVPNPNNPSPGVIDTVSTYSGTVELAYLKSVNADPACFIDLTNGKVYKVSEGKAHATEIDLMWGTRTVTPDQKYWVSTSDNYILNGFGASADLWQDHDLFVGWSKRNATMLDDFQQSANFNAIKTRAEFNAYVNGETGILTYIPFEGKADQINRSYFYDITHNGVKYIGVLKVSQADLADGWAKFTIKVIKA